MVSLSGPLSFVFVCARCVLSVCQCVCSHIPYPSAWSFYNETKKIHFQSICAQLTANFSLRLISDKGFTMEVRVRGEKMGMHMMTVCILQC